MIKDHCKIENLITDLEEKIKTDDDSMVKLFHKFEWKLEKHIFTEEKAIFASYNPDNVIEGYNMLPELTKQHNYILNLLNNWRKDVRKRKQISGVYSLKEFLKNHKNFEEQKVYPKLDQFLDEVQKHHILEKINEII
jgi:hypothetical protein